MSSELLFSISYRTDNDVNQLIKALAEAVVETWREKKNCNFVSSVNVRSKI